MVPLGDLIGEEPKCWITAPSEWVPSGPRYAMVSSSSSERQDEIISLAFEYEELQKTKNKQI